MHLVPALVLSSLQGHQTSLLFAAIPLQHMGMPIAQDHRRPHQEDEETEA